jgi:hypothetical protein
MSADNVNVGIPETKQNKFKQRNKLTAPELDWIILVAVSFENYGLLWVFVGEIYDYGRPVNSL